MNDGEELTWSASNFTRRLHQRLLDVPDVKAMQGLRHIVKVCSATDILTYVC
jgi:hypothetical protein